MSDTLVLLPGLLCDSSIFLETNKIIHQHNPNLNVVCPEYEAIDDIGEIADSIITMIGNENLTLVGFSMGGFVALEIASKISHRCKKIVMLNSNFKAEARDKQLARMDQISRVEEQGLLDVFKKEIMPLYFYEENECLKKTVINMASNFDIKHFKAHSLALKNRKDYTKVLKHLETQISIISGVEDKLCPVIRQIEMSEIAKDARLEIIPKAGHFSILEQKDKVHEALLDFI